MIRSYGQLVTTPGALEALTRNQQTPTEFLVRHMRDDWGDIAEDDKKENDRALKVGERLLSAYRLRDETKIWIITEADRSSTCILLPEEY